MAKLTYGHFALQGVQDCENVMDVSEHRDVWETIGRPTDPEAAINVVRKAWGDEADVREDWIAQLHIPDLEGLDPVRCYEAWRDAWQDCAAGYVRDLVKREWTAGRCEVCGGYDEGNTCCGEPPDVSARSFGAEFVARLPARNGWRAAWEYPGFIAWHHPVHDLTVHASPGWDSHDDIPVEVCRQNGETLNAFAVAWPPGARTVEAYMSVVGPQLDLVGENAEQDHY